MDVAAGQTVSLDANLAVEAQNLKVLVTADRVSAEAEAINRQRTADNILQVLPYDVIRSLPNANLADALGRLPSVTLERDEGEGKYVQVRGTEPRLTNTTIDGVNVPSPETGVRQIKFDAIPADIVESVEINKTLQANMDGDGIGGSINLVTKTAGERPTVALSGMSGYTPILEDAVWSKQRARSANGLVPASASASWLEVRTTGMDAGSTTSSQYQTSPRLSRAATIHRRHGRPRISVLPHSLGARWQL